MEPLLIRLKCLVESKNTVNEDVMGVLLTEIEQFPITLQLLQTTRIGRLLNDLRRRDGVSHAGNVRIRNIIKSWREIVDDASPMQPTGAAEPPSVSSVSVCDPSTLQPESVSTTRRSKHTRPTTTTSIPSPSLQQTVQSRSQSITKREDHSTNVSTPSYPYVSSQSAISPSLKLSSSERSLSFDPKLSSSVIPTSSDSVPIVQSTHKNKRNASPLSELTTSESAAVRHTKKTRPTILSANGVKSSVLSDSSFQSDSPYYSNKIVKTTGAGPTTSTTKLKSTALLLLESGSLKPEITNQILSKDTPKEPALPPSVIPNAARPRHLQEKPRPQPKVRNKARSKVDVTYSSNSLESDKFQRVPLPESSANGVGDFKVHKFFASMDVKYSDNETKLSESAGTGMDSLLSIPHTAALPLISHLQEDSSTTSPDLLPASLETVRNEPIAREADKVEETGFSVEGSYFHKKVKKTYYKSRRRKRQMVPITNHMDCWPELPSLDVIEEQPVSNLQNISPPITSGEVFLKEKLPGRNCLLINRQSGPPLLYNLTDSFMAPLDNDTNIHMLPWCCLHGHRYGRGFPADSIDRLQNIIKRDLPW